MLISSTEAAARLGRDFRHFAQFHPAADRQGATIFYDAEDVDEYARTIDRRAPRLAQPDGQQEPMPAYRGGRREWA